MITLRTNRVLVFFSLFFLLIISLASCSRDQGAEDWSPENALILATATSETSGLPTPTPAIRATATLAPERKPIYLSIVWHQHQPVYYKDPETNVYERPWVRMHAAKDYVDMVTMLEAYPDVHVTFNLTPSLIQQLDDMAAGTKDTYWLHTDIPADQLSDEEKQFILDRFFDTNRRIIGRFPRYVELLEKAQASENPINDFTTEDYRDLQVLFNLAWTDPDWLAEEPLADLVAKGSGFDEADKAIVLGEHLRLIKEVVPAHKSFQEEGKIEITTTPFAHPILPLLVDTNLASEALPEIELPGQEFVYGQDAVAQVEKGIELYTAQFGHAPRGMWPAEGAVAQEIVTMVAQNGIEWMASDEGVLANSLGEESFIRDSAETVVDTDTLYRPYEVQGMRGEPVAIIFRDVNLSDKVAFIYSGMNGKEAAADLIARIHDIRVNLLESGAEGPHLVSVIVDGENPWENYPIDGKEFLRELYQLLNDDRLIKTVTPSEFLALAPEPAAIEDLHAGSWINADFSTWIGEEEENLGWEYLASTRDFLQQYITGSRMDQVTAAERQAAIDAMMIAEGSDWFWWFGSDQTSADDHAFDQQYRNTLKQVYLALGEEPPSFLDVPIIPEEPTVADRPAQGIFSPDINGELAPEEWRNSGHFRASNGDTAAADMVLESLNYGFDGDNLYLLISAFQEHEWPEGTAVVEIYLHGPGGGQPLNFSRSGSPLGFAATGMLELVLEDSLHTETNYYEVDDGTWTAVITESVSESESDLAALDYTNQSGSQASYGDNRFEIAIPLSKLGDIDEGTSLRMRALYVTPQNDALAEKERLPEGGPAAVVVPDLGTTMVVLDVSDPQNDDHGPGSYTYPTAGVFQSGNFDIVSFQAGHTENDVVFKFFLRGPIRNHWNSPNDLSLQTLDVYIDTDGDGQGGEAMLPGRNLSFADGSRWDYAITAEGWVPGIFVPADEGPQQIASAEEFDILVDPDQRKVTIRVPKAILGDDPENWRYAAVILGQDGYPSNGVMRVRDIVPVEEQWRNGGAPGGTSNHTRVLDLVWPERGVQEEWLADFEPTGARQPDLVPSDYARVPMLGPE